MRGEALTRYARAAGLDDRQVVATLWPMLEDEARGDVAQVTVSTPADPGESTALALPALVAIGVAPAVWERARRRTRHRPHRPGLRMDGRSPLIVLDLGAARIFKTPIKGRLVRTPAVSPDGRRVIFEVSRDGTWLLDVAGRVGDGDAVGRARAACYARFATTRRRA